MPIIFYSPTTATGFCCPLWPFGGLLSRVRGKSNVDDFALAAQACVPIISAVLVEIKNKRHPQRCFLNIDVPTNVADHKVQSHCVYILFGLHYTVEYACFQNAWSVNLCYYW